jgi:biopolymer transport protein ExbD
MGSLDGSSIAGRVGMIRYERPTDRVQLDMAPMIDMVFLLLIFFLTATTFTQKEREQDVLLPANRNPGSLSRDFDSNLIVNVLRDGSLRVLGTRLPVVELESLVRDRRERSRLPLKVQVRADRRVPYGGVASVLEAVEKAGVERPYLVAKSEEIEE